MNEDLQGNLQEKVDEVDDSTEEVEQIQVNPARLAAVKILTRFERSDAYLDKLVVNRMNFGDLSEQDKALLNELVNGVIRWRWKLDWVLTGFYRGDYLKCLNIVKNALRVGLYQILFLDKVPDHAAINESVEIIKNIQGEKIAGLVNGVLRNIARNIENIRYPNYDDDKVYYYTIMYSHPRWMVRRWLDTFGEENTVALMEENNKIPFVTVRVNKLKSNIEEILAYLNVNQIEFRQSDIFPGSIIIKSRGVDVSRLSIFQEGKITIQDISASLASLLANAKPGDRIIDLCAAPGGKSFFLAQQIEDNGEIIAIDKYSSKLKIIEEGKRKLGINSIKTLLADAKNLDFKDEFDIVLLDAPCSGLGTLQKKPDIKWKRDRDDIVVLTITQRELLESAAKVTKPGGALIYSTCTIEPEENYEMIQEFLDKHPEFELEPAEKYLPEKVCSNGYMQTFPHIHHTDGAFAARLIKKQ